MAIGGQQNKDTENDALLTLARAVYHAMVLIDQHTDAQAGMDSAAFQAAPYNYSPTEADLVVACLADFTSLLRVFRGQDALAVAKNYRTNLKKLLGAGFY